MVRPANSDKGPDAHSESLDSWNRNAVFWDEFMGEDGNDFQRMLVWPPAERLLGLGPREDVLEIACGNGNFARRMATAGANVVATDFSERMIERARSHGWAGGGALEFRVVDAADGPALARLGERRFDAAVCNMGLMDMSTISPLFAELARLLRPGGRFVFSVMHPCFNCFSTMVLEQEDRDGDLVEVYSIKVSEYLRPTPKRGIAIRNQPAPQHYFHRPLGVLLGAAFEAGFVLDALEEPAFAPDSPPGRHALSWGPNLSQIPPVLVARVRLPASGSASR